MQINYGWWLESKRFVVKHVTQTVLQFYFKILPVAPEEPRWEWQAAWCYQKRRSEELNWSLNVKEKSLRMLLSHTKQYLHWTTYLVVLFYTWFGQREGFQLWMFWVENVYICICYMLFGRVLCTYTSPSWWSKVTMRHYGFLVVS